MKIGITTDIHINDGGSMMTLGLKNRLDYIRESMKWVSELFKSRGITTWIDTGDLTNSDHLSATENTCLNEVLSLMKDFRGYHVLGNHGMKDQDGRFTSVEAIDLLENHTLIRYDEVIDIDCGDSICPCIFFPYTSEGFTQERLDRVDLQRRAKFGFSHATLVNANNYFIGQDDTELRYLDKVFNGHIHDASEWKNIVNIGSLLGSKVNDDYSTARPGVIILDLETGEYERIENPYAPLYFTVSDISEVPNELRSRSYIKVKTKDLDSAKELRGSGEEGTVVVELISEEIERTTSLQEDLMDSLKEYYKDSPEVLDEIAKIDLD